MTKEQILRGELYYAQLDPVMGSEQGGERPVLILQNNKGNQYSPTVVIAPLTTSGVKPPLPTHIEISSSGLRSTSIVLLEQIRTIDKMRIKKYIGSVSPQVMKQIGQAMAVSLGMLEEKSNHQETED